jgi:hypothetical protein
MRTGGFVVVEGLLSQATIEELAAEAVAAYETAAVNEVAYRGDPQERGGAPARRFASAQGGPVQYGFYNAPEMCEMLSGFASLPVAPTGEVATFSYYVSPGDYIDAHRDIPTCDLAVITCLLDNEPGASDGSLCVYPERIREPIASIRKNPDRDALYVHLLPGQTIVLLGGIVPHRLAPVAPAQQRVVSVMCYSVAMQDSRPVVTSSMTSPC